MTFLFSPVGPWFLAEFISWFYPNFYSSSPPIVHLLYTKAYLPSSEASLKSHLFCNYSLETDQISKACKTHRGWFAKRMCSQGLYFSFSFREKILVLWFPVSGVQMVIVGGYSYCVIITQHLISWPLKIDVICILTKVGGVSETFCSISICVLHQQHGEISWKKIRFSKDTIFWLW